MLHRNPLNDFTSERLAELKTEFDQISTIEEKFSFWSKKLHYNYSRVGVDVSTNEVQDFLIRPTTEDEVEELNILLIEEAKTHALLFRKRHGRNVFFDFDLETKELAFKLRDAINPLPILREEIDWIEAEVNKHETAPFKDEAYYRNNPEFRTRVWGNSINDFWLFGYKEFYIKRREPDLTCQRSAPNLIALMNGFAVAQYRVYLEKIKWEYSQSRTSVAQEETSRKQQLLILYHTGMLDKLNHLAVKDRNKLLSVLLNRSEANIRMDLNKIHKKGRTNSIRNEENLDFLFNLLQQTGFEEESEEVKNELDKLR